MAPHTRRGLGEVPHWLRNYQPGGGTSEAALERILQRCQKRGIKVTLVGVPVASAHRQLYTPAIEAKFQSYVSRYVKTYFCEFVDYRSKVPDDLFLDHHHLSPARVHLPQPHLRQGSRSPPTGPAQSSPPSSPWGRHSSANCKFQHINSCLPRKGLNLKAQGRAAPPWEDRTTSKIY